ncbi:MAG: hypothetical protein U7127_09630 [Phormidium sp.]
MGQNKHFKSIFNFDDGADFGQGSRAVEAWFLGSRAENLEELEKLNEFLTNIAQFLILK